jgi:hemerythrin-like metal-binding protein
MNKEKSLPRIEWRDEFKTGVASVDHEHAELVELLNGILEALESSGDKDAVADALGEVHAGISAHFALEEQVMRTRKYDQYGDHKEDHERLLNDIRDIMDAHEDDTYVERKQEFAERLQHWFVDHFQTKDARLHRMLGV